MGLVPGQCHTQPRTLQTSDHFALERWKVEYDTRLGQGWVMYQLSNFPVQSVHNIDIFWAACDTAPERTQISLLLHWKVSGKLSFLYYTPHSPPTN